MLCGTLHYGEPRWCIISSILVVGLSLTACGDKQTEAAIVGDWTLSSELEA